MEKENESIITRNRSLNTTDDVFSFNAWDNVQMDSAELQRALDIIQTHRQSKMPPEIGETFDQLAGSYWDKFYRKHENKFFKDRQWFRSEFKELFSRPSYLDISLKFNVFEVGCGVGNSIFPILASNSTESDFFLYACDFSSTAIDIVKSSDVYDTKKCMAFVYDLASDEMPKEIEPGSIDIIVMVFVLSAISPDKMDIVFSKLFKLLKHGGMLLFRDYARYDMAQLRFKPGRMISENFYVRGDGTQVYFFDKVELESIATRNSFHVIESTLDQRLLVNRQRHLKMHRNWIQCKFQKPLQ